MNLQKAVFKVELEKQKAEKTAHVRDPKLPYFDESRDKMDSYLSRNTRRQMSGRRVFGRRILAHC